jgi:hypothetical protein
MYNFYAYVLNYLDLLKQLIAGIDMELCSMYLLIVRVSNPINTYSQILSICTLNWAKSDVRVSSMYINLLCFSPQQIPIGHYLLIYV